ncbi:MAG: septation protein A [Gammaproteobacteria bacterium]
MKLLFDFFPILIFFIAYKFLGIYTATALFIVASALQIGYYWLRHRRVEKTHIITFIVGVIFGGATLGFHNDLFIKWKPTVIYWLLALVFLATQWFSKKSLLQNMMESNINLPETVWSKLNLSWVLFFISLGSINLYVVYHYSTDAWVNFKLFGLLGLTLAFTIIQGVLLSKHLKSDE